MLCPRNSLCMFYTDKRFLTMWWRLAEQPTEAKEENRAWRTERREIKHTFIFICYELYFPSDRWIIGEDKEHIK